jgi:hypothetical protein
MGLSSAALIGLIAVCCRRGLRVYEFGLVTGMGCSVGLPDRNFRLLTNTMLHVRTNRKGITRRAKIWVSVIRRGGVSQVESGTISGSWLMSYTRQR